LYLFLVLIVIVVWYAWPRIPIITGYAAKSMCSGVFVAERQPASIKAQDLSFFPINLAKAKVNYADKSVTATLFGLAKRKAVYREGLGSALITDLPESKVRELQFNPSKLFYNPDTVLWPLGDKMRDTIFPEVNYSMMDSILSTAIDESEAEPLKKTFAVAIIYKNQLIGESYASGIDSDTRLLGWSMTKSLTNALIGLLVKEGKLKTNEPAPIDSWSACIYHSLKTISGSATGLFL